MQEPKNKTNKRASMHLLYANEQIDLPLQWDDCQKCRSGTLVPMHTPNIRLWRAHKRWHHRFLLPDRPRVLSKWLMSTCVIAEPHHMYHQSPKRAYFNNEKWHKHILYHLQNRCDTETVQILCETKRKHGTFRVTEKQKTKTKRWQHTNRTKMKLWL